MDIKGSVFSLDRIRKSFGGLLALDDVSLTLGENEIVGILGLMERANQPCSMSLRLSTDPMPEMSFFMDSKLPDGRPMLSAAWDFTNFSTGEDLPEHDGDGKCYGGFHLRQSAARQGGPHRCSGSIGTGRTI